MANMANGKDSSTVSTVIPKTVKDKLDEIAAKEDRTVSWLVRQIIMNYLEQQEKEN